MQYMILTIQFLSKLIIQFLPSVFVGVVAIALITAITKDKNWLRRLRDKAFQSML